jgi:preprotein translocase subunit SecD
MGRWAVACESNGVVHRARSAIVIGARFGELRVVTVIRFVGLVTLAAALLLSGCGRRAPEHGVQYVIAIETDAAPGTREHAKLLDDTVDFLGRRLESQRVHFAVERDGQGRVVVRVEELQAARRDAVRRAVARPGRLEFRLVHDGGGTGLKTGSDVPGYEWLKMDDMLAAGGAGVDEVESLLVSRVPDLAGHVEGAFASTDDLGRPGVTVELDPVGAKRFEEITRNASDRRLAIVVDRRILSAPVIREPIVEGRCQISGSFSADDARMLVTVLTTVPPVDYRVLEERPF